MKFTKALPLFATMLAVGMTFVACDKDDDESGGGSSATIGQLSDGHGNENLPDGYAISSVGNYYRFTYDEQGKLSQIYADGEYVDFSTKGITIEDKDGYAKISFNSKGLISKCKTSFEGEESNYTYKNSEEYSFSYNGNNQLSTISGSYNESGTEKGKKYSSKASGTIKFTYSGKKLTKVVQSSSYTDVEDGEKYTGSETCTFTFEYNKENENIYGQWTPRLADIVLDMNPFFDAAAFVGCLGRATSVLPDVIYEVSVEKENGETDTDEDTYSCSYVFNANGTLRTADGWSYTYTVVGDNDVKSTRSAEVNPLKPFVSPKATRRGLFMRRHNRK